MDIKGLTLEGTIELWTGYQGKGKTLVKVCSMVSFPLSPFLARAE